VTMIEKRINELLTKGEKLLIPYVMCGDGGYEKTRRLVRFLEEAGASLIEIGIAFSDPIADGPSIQAAGQRALDGGVTLKKTLAFLKGFPPGGGVPRIMMTYLNPLVRYGTEAFFKDLKEAKISGVIIPDLPLEEYETLLPCAESHGIAVIPLVAPGTGRKRLEHILDKTRGFVYTVTVNGTTGARSGFDEAVLQRLEEIKKHTGMPVVAGFGVSTADHIRTLGAHCDGVVVGSKIVNLAHENRFEAIKELMSAGKQPPASRR